jgi:hypothetical protein
MNTEEKSRGTRADVLGEEYQRHTVWIGSKLAGGRIEVRERVFQRNVVESQDSRSWDGIRRFGRRRGRKKEREREGVGDKNKKSSGVLVVMVLTRHLAIAWDCLGRLMSGGGTRLCPKGD